MKDLINKANKRIFICASGILLGISVVFAEVGLLSYVALLPLALVLIMRIDAGGYSPKKAYLDGFAFFMCYHLVTFHWFLYFYPLDFTGMSRPAAMGVVALAWIGVPLIQSTFSALAFVGVAYFVRTEIYKKDIVTLAFFVSAAFVLNEWTQTLTWAGIPWSRIAISHVKMPILMQSASLFGSYFISFIVVLFNFLIAIAILRRERSRGVAIAALTVILCNILCGAVLYAIPNADSDKTVEVASIQGNLPSQVDRGFFYQGVFEVYEKMTLEAAADGAELVFWPEGVYAQDIHGLITDSECHIVGIDEAVSELAVRCGATIVLGTVYIDEGDYYNSISVFYPNGGKDMGAYSKIRLVPFGEFLPFESLVNAIAPSLGMINTLPSSLTPGEKSEVFDSSVDGKKSLKVGTLTCFDSIYEELGISSVKEGAQLFYIPSDDSWFYDSRALDMHHAQNILRAVEQGRYTVSCGNTGITSIVDSKGNLLAEISDNEEGYVRGTVLASDNRTLYSYIGNLFVYLCIAFIVAVFAKQAFMNQKERKNKGYN